MAGLMKNGWGEGDSGRKAKKRSKTAEKMHAKKMRKTEDGGFDMAPDDIGDDFNMDDLTGTLKKQKAAVNALKKVETAAPVVVEKNALPDDATTSKKAETPAPSVAGTPAGALSLSQEKRDAKVLNIHPTKEKKEATIVAPRMDGESKKAFQKRMKNEVQRAIRSERMQDNRNPEKKQRKKEFMNAKKKNKKRKGGRETSDDDFDDSRRNKDRDIDDMVTGDRGNQPIIFGEQVQRPPTFQVLPRGATTKRKMTGKSKNDGMSDAQRKAEHHAMEKMRLKVQAQYALMKAKRKQEKDFHL
jgi:hypothetical protein